jgi:hypothetical protein
LNIGDQYRKIKVNFQLTEYGESSRRIDLAVHTHSSLNSGEVVNLFKGKKYFDGYNANSTTCVQHQKPSGEAGHCKDEIIIQKNGAIYFLNFCSKNE